MTSPDPMKECCPKCRTTDIDALPSHTGYVEDVFVCADTDCECHAVISLITNRERI